MITIPDDVFYEILKHVPPSLNICLVNKMFYETKKKRSKPIRTVINESTDLVWVLKESKWVEKFNSINGILLRNKIIYIAFSEGRYDVLEELDNLNDHKYLTGLVITSKDVNIDILDWQLRSPFGECVRDNAEISLHCMMKKDMNLLKWIMENGIPLDYGVSSLAANGNWIQGIRTIVELDYAGFTWASHTLGVACEKCDIEDIKWMLENGCGFSERDLHHVGVMERMDILELLLYDKYKLDSNITNYVLWGCRSQPESRVKKLLTYAYERFGWSQKAYHPLLMFYPLKMVEWAMRNGCPFYMTKGVIYHCVYFQRMDVIKMLKALRVHDKNFDIDNIVEMSIQEINRYAN